MLSGRVALVTGASRGIGAAIAVRLAEHGAAVGVNYVANEAAGAGVVDAIGAAGGKAVLLHADVRAVGDVQRMVSEIEQALGPVDILVNNANIGFPTKGFLEFGREEFEAKLLGEMRALFHCCQAVLPGMVARAYGRIINISSTLSRTPGPGFLAHSCAKSALDAFTRSLAQEFGASGVTVNTVAPGLTETDATAHLPAEVREWIRMSTPAGRIAQPADVAGVVLGLASEAAGFVTGAYLPADGGKTML